MSFDPLSPLPFLTAELPGIGGRIKQAPEDFEVEEIPAYEPSGSGGFLYLWIEKRDMGAEYFIRQVARRLGLPNAEVGTAGLKDRRAVTRQMVSVPEQAAERVGELDGDGIRVLAVHRHSNKLRPGHLHGNRFRIVIRDVAAEAGERVAAIVARIRQEGLPNFYGSQRFGRDGETFHMGEILLSGGREPAAGAPEGSRRLPRSPFLKKLALSSVQSALFNHYLVRRMSDGLMRRVLVGDVMAKWPFGGMFVAEDVSTEQARFEARETVPAGPIFGKKTFAARGEAAEREAIILADGGLSPASFGRFGKLVMGTRRHNLVYVDDLAAALTPSSVELTFTLPAGSYATGLVREFTKNDEKGSDNEESVV